MTVHCEIAFPNVSDEEMRTLDYGVMGHAFATHTALGRLCDESVYQGELLRRLKASGIDAMVEVPVVLSFGAFSITLKLDLVVERKVIYELKTVDELNHAHEGQLLSYLFLTRSTHGKLVNFRNGSVKSRFVNTTLGYADHRRFDVVDDRFSGKDCLSKLVRELVAEWGTGLDASLYRRAIIRCLAGENENERLLPMISNGATVGNQRFHLLDSDQGIVVTTYSNVMDENRRDFQKLVAHSPLKQLHWVNVTNHRVTIETVENPAMCSQ